MFEGQGGNRIARLAAAADAAEGDDRADIAAPARERGCFRRCVEILALQANGHVSPVIPGRRAAASPESITATGSMDSEPGPTAVPE